MLNSRWTRSSTGVSNVDLTGIQEIVRFEYTFDVGDDPTDGVHFLMMSSLLRAGLCKLVLGEWAALLIRNQRTIVESNTESTNPVFEKQ